MLRRAGKIFGGASGGASSVKPTKFDTSSLASSYRPRASTVADASTGASRTAGRGLADASTNAARSARKANLDTVADSALDVGKRTNPSALRKLGKACKKNPGKCAAAGAGVGLAAYAADTFFENSAEQRECILQCLPSNWDLHKNSGEVPEYHSTDDDDPPRCTSGDCESYCQQRCEALHPTTAGGVVGETLKGVTGKVLDTAGSFLYDLLDALGLPMDTILLMLEMMPYILGLIAVLWAYSVLMRLKRLIVPSRRYLSYYPPPYAPPPYAPPPSAPPPYTPPYHPPTPPPVSQS